MRGFRFAEAIQTAPISASLFRHECLKTARYAPTTAVWAGFRLAWSASRAKFDADQASAPAVVEHPGAWH
jgi:hypothetical protein